MPKTEECQELKNINYQSMLLNKNNKVKTPTPTTINIDNFLSKERKTTHKKKWTKLGNSDKIKKLMVFHKSYSVKHKLNVKDSNNLKTYLLNCLERKQLQRTKEVNYDEEKGVIKGIHGLSYNKNLKKFTLKRNDKKSSSLKSLAPKRKKNKIDKNIKDIK
tara:strand:- start:628 stop:1110 length:483 start_codon:yes stop_codon:yes gene_type:complete